MKHMPTCFQAAEAADLCSMCKGGADKNKQGEAEELVTCSECKKHGESGSECSMRQSAAKSRVQHTVGCSTQQSAV